MIFGQIGSLASGILTARFELVEALELAEEMLDSAGAVALKTTGGYHDFATKYGQQRAILRGLTAGEVLKHDINDPATYQAGHTFTLPTFTQFGYVVLDANGDEVIGWSAADYYLTKVSSPNVLATNLNNPDGFASPIVSQSTELAKAGTADGASTAWVASVVYKASTLVLPTTPNGFFFKTTIPGTSSSVEPVWPTIIGATVVDGGVTWINAGRLISEWVATTEYKVSDRIYPATPMGDYFQATPLKELAATHAGTPNRMALVAATIAPGILGVPVARLGAWQSIRGPNSAIQQFSFVAQTGANRLLVYVSGLGESSAVDKPIREVTYGGKVLTRVVTAAANSNPGIARAEIWILKEADLAAAVGDDFIVSYAVDGSSSDVASHGCVIYQNVNQVTPIAATVKATDAGPSPTNPITANLNIVGNSMQVAVVWADVDGGFTWNPEWDRQLDVNLIPGGGGSLSVADSDDVVGTTDGTEPVSWPVSLGGTTVDGNITWKNIGSTVMDKTTANPMVANTVSILIDGEEVGRDDGAGNIIDVSPFTLIDSGSVTYTTGVVSVTFKAPQVIGELVSVRFDAIINLTEWEVTYDQLDFTLSTLTYGSSNQYTLKLIDLLSGDIGTVPEILSQMQVRKKSDHSVLGTLIVLVEGLQASTSWDRLLDPPGEATEVSDDEFRLLLGYMNPTSADDIVKSADLNNVSNAQENPADTYPNIELNPMFPATQGNHAAFQPSPLGIADAFADVFVQIEDRGSGDEVRWFVLTGFKFKYEVSPTASELLATPLDPQPEDPDTMDSGLDRIVSFSPNQTLFPLRIPADVSGGSGDITFAAVGAGGGGGSTYVGWSSVDDWSPTISYSMGDFVRPITGDTGFVFEVTSAGTSDSQEPSWDRTNGNTTGDAGVTWTCRSDVSGEFACYYNEVQHLIDDGADSMSFLATQFDALAAVIFVNTIDTGQQASDTTFDTAQNTFETDLDGFLTSDHGSTVTAGYDPTAAANRVGGGGSDYPFAEIETNLDGAATTFIPIRATRETEISDDILGTSLVASTSGLDYAKLLYDAANLAVNQDIGFMRRVLDKLDSIQALYDVIAQFQTNYAKYP